jgi:hypothetical protein
MNLKVAIPRGLTARWMLWGSIKRKTYTLLRCGRQTATSTVTLLAHRAEEKVIMARNAGNRQFRCGSHEDIVVRTTENAKQYDGRGKFHFPTALKPKLPPLMRTTRSEATSTCWPLHYQFRPLRTRPHLPPPPQVCRAFYWNQIFCSMWSCIFCDVYFVLLDCCLQFFFSEVALQFYGKVCVSQSDPIFWTFRRDSHV